MHDSLAPYIGSLENIGSQKYTIIQTLTCFIIFFQNQLISLINDRLDSLTILNIA